MLWPALLLFFSACVKDKPVKPTTTIGGDTVGNVYIVCEGALGNGNGSFSLYQPDNETISNNIYEAVNGQPLGDVFESMQRIGDKFFLCINNSDKVIVIDAASKKHIASISIPKPRHILPVSDIKAYVSTLFSNKVYIINPQTCQVTGSITIPAQNTEAMLLHKGAAYCCAWDTSSNKVYKLNPSTDKIEQEIVVGGFAPHTIAVDKFDMLWVLSGNVTKGKRAALTRIDPVGEQTLAIYQFPEKTDPIRLVTNTAKDELYFISVNYKGGTEHNGIYRMGITDAGLPEQPFIQAKQYQYFWALGVEPVTDKLYIGDPKGFIQKGSVLVYSNKGEKEKEFSVGIGPGHFYFDTK
ncbi:MAG: YncE family protein [Flavipsychrobacter sp.]|nr:YncE family protein [Flavipsychrobacter sp.]